MERMFLITILISMLVSGCTFPLFRGEQPTSAPTPIPVRAITNTPPPPPPPLPTVPPPTAVPPSPTPFTPFEALVWVNNVNLRTNPGLLFLVSLSLQKDTPVQVLGKSPGGEWIFVKTQDNTNGWIFAQLLQSGVDLQEAPLLQPLDVQEVRGLVADADNRPVSGIQFAIIQGGNRAAAMTDDSGGFFAYMPLTAAGTWTVSYDAIACTSNTMDAECNCKGGICGSVDPAMQTLTLPQTEMLKFSWREIQ